MAAQHYPTLEEAREALGDTFVWRSVTFGEVGGVLQWQTRQGEWISWSTHKVGTDRATPSGAVP